MYLLQLKPLLAHYMKIGTRSWLGFGTEIDLSPGTTVAVTGKNAAEDWLFIDRPHQIEGWVSAALVEVNASCLGRLPEKR